MRIECSDLNKAFILFSAILKENYIKSNGKNVRFKRQEEQQYAIFRVIPSIIIMTLKTTLGLH